MQLQGTRSVFKTLSSKEPEEASGFFYEKEGIGMWETYEVQRKHKADFRVSYRIYSENEGGRHKPVFQGYRCDFSYEGDNPKSTGIYCIHPEFEDEQGDIILDNKRPVPLAGTARMWILFPEMRREVHVHRIATGIKGYFMEGPRRVGEVEVIEILDLYDNAVLLD